MLAESNHKMSDWKDYLSPCITGMANFATQYNFQSVSVALLIMSQSQCTSTDAECAKGKQAEWVTGASQAAVFVGAVVGQIGMGFLGDYFINRSVALSITLFVAAISIAISTFASVGTPTSVYAIIIAFRFLTGIGLGGVYPLSATKAAEDAEHQKGKVNAVASSWSFFWQYPAMLLPYLFGYIFAQTKLPTVIKWKIILGLGVIPVLITIMLIYIESSLNCQESEANNIESPQPIANNSTYVEHDIENNNSSNNSSENKQDIVIQIQTIEVKMENIQNKTNQPKLPHHKIPSLGSIKFTHKELSIQDTLIKVINNKDILRKLLVSGGTWFLYDILQYGLTLMSGYILHSISGKTSDVSSNHNIENVCSKQLIAFSITIPVTIVSIYLMPILGTKNLQSLGFLILCVFFILLSGLFNYLKLIHDYGGLFALYCLAYASLSFGIGITTFSLPAELFEENIRSTCNGIAAAVGKFGAAVGTFTFYYIAQAWGYPTLLSICTVIAFIGCISSYIGIHSHELLGD